MDALALVVLYLLLVAVTRTLDQGDTPGYAVDIVAALQGETGRLWEFGHLLWRPVGFAVVRLIIEVEGPAIVHSHGTLLVAAVRVLTVIATASGAAAVLLFRLWLGRLEVPRLAAAVATGGFLSAAGFINYAETGSAYVPALAMLLLAFYALAADDHGRSAMTVAVASIGFAGAVLLWAPMILGVPGAALSMILLRGADRPRVRTAVLACVISGCLTIAVYLVIARAAELHSAHDLRLWIASASHGIEGIGGLPRALVGFARSIVNMGQLGLVVKRHLVHDPYNPTTWLDVVRAGLPRLVLLYLVLGGICLVLARRTSGRRVLAFAACSAAPVIAFALYWQGGDVERYLAFYPALFAAAAYAMALLPTRSVLTIGPVAIATMCVVNARAIARSKSTHECTLLADRLASIPRTPRSPTLVISPHGLDEIVLMKVRCPTSPVVTDSSAPEVHGLVMSNSAFSYEWHSWLAARAKEVWNAGGHIWLSRRAFSAAPSASWRWAEGDDPRLSWREFPEYFRQVDIGLPVGGMDGFVELLPTERTRAFIADRATTTTVAGEVR
ncbi:MAG TPA: hypothetical protein VLN49_18955 [Gemmatimonadaceae bacterium]|nr:hypothetical protein [Gemmatimonadaceae bacterium]